jgi:hypothetical protein
MPPTIKKKRPILSNHVRATVSRPKLPDTAASANATTAIPANIQQGSVHASVCPSSSNDPNATPADKSLYENAGSTSAAQTSVDASVGNVGNSTQSGAGHAARQKPKKSSGSKPRLSKTSVFMFPPKKPAASTSNSSQTAHAADPNFPSAQCEEQGPAGPVSAISATAPSKRARGTATSGRGHAHGSTSAAGARQDSAGELYLSTIVPAKVVNDVPYQLRGKLEVLLDRVRVKTARRKQILENLIARIHAILEEANLPLYVDANGNPTRADGTLLSDDGASDNEQADVDPAMAREAKRLRRTRDNALASLSGTNDDKRMKEQIAAAFVNRYLDLETKARERRRREANEAAMSEKRFLPVYPAVSAAAAAAQSTGSVELPHGPASGTGSASGGAASATSAVNFTATGDGKAASQRPVNSLAAMRMTTETHVDYAAALEREAGFVLGNDQRPVSLLPFDTCTHCRVAMWYNHATQHLVCPMPGCSRWKRFADRTSNALAFGEEVEYHRFHYRPINHMEDILRYAEAGESKIVPPQEMERIMRFLRKYRIRREDITIRLVKLVISIVGGVKTEHTMQIHSRLTGIVPRRMSPLLKDKLRLMFIASEAPFQKYRDSRINHLSFPYSIYKYLELTGYWEYLQAFQLLKYPNLLLHDNLFRQVCGDLDWEFIPTVQSNESNDACVVGTSAALAARALRAAEMLRNSAPAIASSSPSTTGVDATNAANVLLAAAMGTCMDQAPSSSVPRPHDQAGSSTLQTDSDAFINFEDRATAMLEAVTGAAPFPRPATSLPVTQVKAAPRKRQSKTLGEGGTGTARKRARPGLAS